MIDKDTSGNMVSNFKWATPYKYWKKATINPIGSALGTAAILGGTAYLGAPMAAKFLGKMNRNLPGPLQHEVSDEEIEKFRRRMTLIAALGGAGLSVWSNLDTEKPFKSMMKWDYGEPENPTVPTQPKTGIHKTQSLKNIRKRAMLGNAAHAGIMSMDVIPLDHAQEIVANDKFLSSGQKAAITSIFNRTSRDSATGNTSMADLTSGAIRAGLGFAGGAIAGYALGKIFALPEEVTRTASMTGGLANALRVSGLIS